MTFGLVNVIIVILVCLCGVFVSGYMFREKVSQMHGMLFSMSMAMGIGLFVGTLVGILFQGNLLMSSLLGIGAGFIVGTIIGTFYSFLAVMEGMLSGIMAGMMGAMLGEMVKPIDWDKTIMIMFTMVLFICFLVIFEIFNHVKYQSNWIRIYQNPFVFGPIFILVCLLIYSQAPFFTAMIPHNGPHH